jgi:plastocyanin
MKNQLTRFANNILILFVFISVAACSTSEERVKANKKETKVYTVVIQQMKFTPAEIGVNEGDTVIWINRDIVDHNVTEEKNKEWSSSTLAPGKSWNMIVKKDADYLCTIHPVMKGKLTVK